ncbi:MAG: methyltransferase domain-containing protein [Planctomycetota bacterium]|nr:MAG: methyltransferase domain-containing protein [Planctomycetota bacterium]
MTTTNLAEYYDAVAFPGQPIARAQPDFLETSARLRGLHAMPAAEARVLELGCATGRNLLPLAERYPQASFVGIDNSGKQIAAAHAAAVEVGLSNVEFLKADILDLDQRQGTFDYIIAHGVYSWVDEPVRDKLLAACREHLAPEGIAYVSYKTYPGWHVHNMLRHMMLYDSRNAETPADRIARSRRLIEFLQAGLTEDNPYDSLVQGEMAVLARQGDEYLWHDHLEPFSHPVYFKQFVEHARGHGLQVAGEASLGWRPVDQLAPELEQRLATITRDALEQEQFRDIVRNRGMRQTLLCHSAVELPSRLSPEVLRGLYLAAPLRPEEPPIDLKSTGVQRFFGAAGMRVGTPLPLAKAALSHLGEAWPEYVAFDDLVAAACRRVEEATATPSPPEDVRRLSDNLLQCCLGQVVSLYAAPPSYATRATDKPLASPLARSQARATDVVANRRHEAVRLDSFDRHVLDLLDGNRDRNKLIEELAAAVAEGKLTVLEHQQPVRSYDEASRIFQAALPEALERLAKLALLVK